MGKDTVTEWQTTPGESWTLLCLAEKRAIRVEEQAQLQDTLRVRAETRGRIQFEALREKRQEEYQEDLKRREVQENQERYQRHLQTRRDEEAAKRMKENVQIGGPQLVEGQSAAPANEEPVEDQSLQEPWQRRRARLFRDGAFGF